MNICFYAPFKPLGHPAPSGDRVIGAGIYDFLAGRGHRLWTASDLRCRWIYWQPWRWPLLSIHGMRILRELKRRRPALWLTYHSYYKAPDLLGPAISRGLGVPYVVFQGIYATKYRRRLRTMPGYYLNRMALRTAAHIFTNKRVDLKNLGRLIPPERLTYLSPGIVPGDFRFDASARTQWRSRWGVGSAPVVAAAAMFRKDVKTRGLLWLIRACGRLHRQGRRFFLAIAGDGRERATLERAARQHLPDRVIFTGKIARGDMHRFYSTADLFAFPGIRESLGMVYLEAQACGLPVVAFRNGGIPEVVRDGRTGFLTPPYSEGEFIAALDRLLKHPDLCRRMGQAGTRYVGQQHDIQVNYQKMETVLMRIAGGRFAR